MPRPLRYVPPGSVVEVTARTVARRFLLRPSPTTNDLVLGVIGRAQELYGVRIFAMTFMSNHMHALLGVDDAAQLADFMRHILTNIAKEVGRHHVWEGPFWSRRYRSIVVADAESQAARLQYVLCQGLKEGLVDRAADWPGASSTAALTQGKALKGTWFDRTAQCHAAGRGRRRDSAVTEKTYSLRLFQIPALMDKSPQEYRKFVSELVRQRENEVRAERLSVGKRSVFGVRRILEERPHAAPKQSDRRPAPFVHATSRSVRDSFRASYAAFVDAFRSAAACLRNGHNAGFPEGAFPPPLPFVTSPPV